MDAGDVYLADLNQERHHYVLVVSDARFNRMAQRVLVAPELPGPPDEVPYPWRISANGRVFAVDLLRSLPSARLLERVDRVPSAVMQSVRRVVVSIV